ncbi:uncharacterized protein N7511_005234 [Penicillium nucicola]|uniref:uncharacterized protein n=1 Tax=Penicillium nucicola TaxID=1850975 RepID=UPI0025457780|nr:uncharacterized protein N7511_005234 [Penicillium nucicola]KAJ5761852.1 hypothetical protein N7511_005234 [Penicillium nucicola]
MKGCLVLLGLLAATSPATAALISFKNGALTKTNRNCDGSVIGSPQTQTFGTVELSRVGNQLVAVPVLLGGTPNKSFNVRLIQLNAGGALNCGTCASGGGTLNTNNAGIGNGYVQQTILPGATSAWVDLNQKDNCDNFYDIAPLPLT